MTDYIVITQRIVGNPADWETLYAWDGVRHASTDAAVKAGWRAFDHDDFNVGRVEGCRLVWFGWQDEQLDDYDLAEIARKIGLTA